MYKAASCAILACLLGLAAAAADEVVLTNGDRLTGKVLRLTGGKLILKVDYSKKIIEIDKSKVKSIRTDGPVELHLADGQVVKGKLRTDEKGRLVAEPGAGRGAVTLEWSKVAAINPPKSLWHGSVTVGGADQSGNTDRSSFSAAAEAVRRTKRDRFGLRFLFNYAKEDGEMTARNTFGASKYDYFLTKKLYSYLSVEMLSDEFRDLKLRTVTGAGLGWQVVERADLSFALEAGAAHINEDFEEAEDEGRIAARGSAILKWKIFGKVTFSNRLTVLPSLEDDQYQLRNEAALATPLGAGWSLKLSNVFEYDSQPPAGVKKTDRIWILGLQYRF